MAKRYKPNQRKSQKKFTALAMKTNKKNLTAKPMRGGYRI